MGFDADFQKPISGSINAAGSAIDISSPNSVTSVVQVTGIWSGSLLIQGSNDEINWYVVPAIDNATGLLAPTLVSPGIYIAQTNGYQFNRVYSATWASGSAVLNVYGSDAPSVVSAVSLFRGGSDGTILGNNGDSLKVSAVVPSTTDGLDIKYNEISSIGAGSETSIISFTATVAYRVKKIFVAGENIALFRVKLNGATIISKRTFFGNLNEEFSFEDFNVGLKLKPLDQISVTVIHSRPFTSNFESTILGTIVV